MGAGSTRAEQVLGGLSDLPVAVLEGAFQGCLDVVALERCEGQHGPASDRRSVPEATQYRRSAPLVPARRPAAAFYKDSSASCRRRRRSGL